METLVGLVLITISLFMAVMFLYSVIANQIRILLGYRLYKYTKIPFHGQLIEKYKWCKTDEEARQHFYWFDFIEIIKPFEKRIKPKE